MIFFSAATPDKNTNDENDDQIIRNNTNLIQVEAIVKDKNEKIMNDLTVDDFEIVAEISFR